MTKEIEINGTLASALLAKATIVKTRFDGQDWHALVKLAKGQVSELFEENDPEYAKGTAQYEIHTQTDGKFYLMSAHRATTERQIVNRFDEWVSEYWVSNRKRDERLKREAEEKEREQYDKDVDFKIEHVIKRNFERHTGIPSEEIMELGTHGH